MKIEKEHKGLPEYETPSMVTYQAKDILEKIGITSGSRPPRKKPPFFPVGPGS